MFAYTRTIFLSVLRSSEIAWSVLVETRSLCFVAETIREARAWQLLERERDRREREQREEKGGRKDCRVNGNEDESNDGVMCVAISLSLSLSLMPHVCSAEEQLAWQPEYREEESEAAPLAEAHMAETRGRERWKRNESIAACATCRRTGTRV